jgi:hypothetical protein
MTANDIHVIHDIVLDAPSGEYRAISTRKRGSGAYFWRFRENPSLTVGQNVYAYQLREEAFDYVEPASRPSTEELAHVMGTPIKAPIDAPIDASLERALAAKRKVRLSPSQVNANLERIEKLASAPTAPFTLAEARAELRRTKLKAEARMREAEQVLAGESGVASVRGIRRGPMVYCATDEDI